MTLKKALASSMLAATVLIAAASMTGQADPLPLKSQKTCGQAKPWATSCPHSGKDAMLAEFAQKVGLSAEQKKQVEAIHKDAETHTKPIYEQMVSKRKALYEYLATPEATEREALSRQSVIDDLRSPLSQRHLATMFRTTAILTPEQQKKPAALIKEKMATYEKKGGHCAHYRHW